MLLIRRFEEKAGQLYGMGQIGGFCHLYIGQEAVVVGIQSAQIDGDSIVTSYRDHGHMLACDMDPKGVMAAITLISKFVSQENYISSSITVIVVCSVTAFLSITSWALLGKFLRKFATNNEFIKRFNYAMSILLVGCVASFYI